MHQRMSNWHAYTLRDTGTDLVFGVDIPSPTTLLLSTNVLIFEYFQLDAAGYFLFTGFIYNRGDINKFTAILKHDCISWRQG